MMPVARSVQRVCGREYHDAQLVGDAEMMFCKCNTVAIGRCTNDHRPVCGYHSDFRENKRLCNDCIEQFDKHELDSALRPLRLLIEHVARLDDLADQFLALLFISPNSIKIYGFGHEVEDLVTQARCTLLSRIKTEPWHLGNGRNFWMFDPGPLMQRWRQSNLLGPPVELHRVHYEGRRSVVAAIIDGWQIQVGNVAPGGPLSGTSAAPDMYVLSDGTIAVVKFQSRIIERGSQKASLDKIEDLIRLGHLTMPSLPPEANAAFNNIIYPPVW